MTDRSPSSLSGADERDPPVLPDSTPILRSVIDTVADGVVVLEEGTVTFANAAIEDVLGYDPSALVGEHVSTLVPEGRHAYRGALELLLQEGTLQSDFESLEVPVTHADGHEQWVTLTLRAHEPDGRRLTTATLRDVSDDRERDGQLERYRRIMETIDDGIYILDSSFTITNVNEAMVSMTGYDRDELIGSHASLLADEGTLEEAAALSAELLENPRNAATLTTELATADGGTVPIETRFSLYPFDDERYGQVGVVRDVTDRKQYEETLTALNESTRELLELETKPDVCGRIVDTATDVIDLSAAGVYLFDRAANELHLTARSSGQDSGAERERPGDREPTDDAEYTADPERRTVGPDDGVAWESFVDGETTVPDESDPVLPDDRGMYVPLGDHALFVAGAANGRVFDDNTRQLVDLLAASAEAALSRVEREIEVRERDAERERQNRRLRQLDRINTIIRELDQALVEAETHDDIRRAVCDRLVAADRFDFAWIAEPDALDETLEPRAWTGGDRGYLDGVSLSLGGGREPSVRAAESRELTVVQNVGDDLRKSPWRKAALSRDYRSVVSVPLLYEEHLYGVLTVYASRPSAFDDMVQAVLAELGQTIANAMNAVETKQALLTDSSVELEFRLRAADDPLLRLARAADTELTLRGSIPESDGTTRVFVTARDAPLDRVRSVAEESLAVESIRPIADRDDEGVFEAVVAGTGVASTLADHGAGVRTITADSDGITALVDLPDEASVRSFVETIRSTYPETELVSRRSLERPVRTPLEFRSEFEERLTERQDEILRIAYLSGFFEWPRESTRQEIADSLGVSQPTINRHLRTCERKLFSMLLDE